MTSWVSLTTLIKIIILSLVLNTEEVINAKIAIRLGVANNLRNKLHRTVINLQLRVPIDHGEWKLEGSACFMVVMSMVDANGFIENCY